MSIPYLPPSQSALASWAANFSAQISAAPGAFGLMASDADTIATAYGRYRDALTPALVPETRTKPAVANKDAQRAAMLWTLRLYAQTIKRNLGVSNEAKIGLGIPVPHSDRAPVSAPQTAPVLHVTCTSPLCQSVGFRDTLTRRAKPPGVTAMLLVAAVVDGGGDTAPTDPDALPVRGIATRQSIGVTFTSADRAKTACYFGRWITGTGLLGPWSQMASLVIAA